jgi:membrane protein
MRFQPKNLWLVVKTAAIDWWEDKAPRLGAALAYYSLFSLAPLLVLITAIAGIVFGQEAVEGRLVEQFRGVIGHDAGEALQSMIAKAHKPATSIIATITGIAMLLIGASGVFGQLQGALNTIWDVKPKAGRGIKGVLKDRFLSFAMVVVVGFLLLVSLVISTALTAIGEWATSVQPEFAAIWNIVNIIVSFAIIAVLFALIFKLLPDAKIAPHLLRYYSGSVSWGLVSISPIVRSLRCTAPRARWW